MIDNEEFQFMQEAQSLSTAAQHAIDSLAAFGLRHEELYQRRVISEKLRVIEASARQNAQAIWGGRTTQKIDANADKSRMILNAISECTAPPNAYDLIRITGINKASVYRHLRLLRNNGDVKQQSDGCYILKTKKS